MSFNLGIDFGTSNSGAAFYDGRQVHMLPIDQHNNQPEVVKTILYITRDHQHIIGQAAVERYYQHNVNRARRFVRKRVGEVEYRGGDMFYIRDVFMDVDELQPGRLLRYLKTALRVGNYNGTQVFDRFYSLAELITAYLRQLKTQAETLLAAPVAQVTLGRPVQFSTDPGLDHKAEETLRQAALAAGFENVDFELEPVAAALYYETRLTRPQNTLIFDFGGGTLDITILRLGDPANRRIYASGGIGLAGSDFDRALIHRHLLPHFGSQVEGLSIDLQELIRAVAEWSELPEWSTPRIQAQLQRAITQDLAPVQLSALQSLVFNDLAFSFYNTVEAAKIALSTQGAAAIAMRAKYLDLWQLVTRWQFEQDIHPHYVEIARVLEETLRASGLEPGQIDAVVKTGGSSNIPLFDELLAQVFGRQRLLTSDVFTSVTAGLAIRAFGGPHPRGAR